MENKYLSEIKPVDNFQLGLRELVKFHELFYFFAWRDIKVKYKQTVLGFLWAIFQPLIMTLILSLTLGQIVSFPSSNMPYPVFVISGLIFWSFFSNGVSSSANSMLNNASIIRKVYFPRLIIPLSALLVVLFDSMMALIVFFGFLIYYGLMVNPLLIAGKLLLAVVLSVLATLGPGCLLAALNVKYRDFRYIVPFVIQLGLFVSPVLYSVGSIENRWLKLVLTLNPMSFPIEFFRSSIGNMPMDWNFLWPGLLVSCFLFISGIYYFRKTEAYFADLA